MTELVATVIARPARASLAAELASFAAPSAAPSANYRAAKRSTSPSPRPTRSRTFGNAPATNSDPLPVDVIIQPVAGRRKKLLVADMDSTIIGQECLDELADFVGLKAHVAAITERAMRGEIEFEPALRERVALLKGLPRHDDRQGHFRTHHP